MPSFVRMREKLSEKQQVWWHTDRQTIAYTVSSAGCKPSQQWSYKELTSLIKSMNGSSMDNHQVSTAGSCTPGSNKVDVSGGSRPVQGGALAPSLFVQPPPLVFPPTSYYSPFPNSALGGPAPQSILARTATCRRDTAELESYQVSSGFKRWELPLNGGRASRLNAASGR